MAEQVPYYFADQDRVSERLGRVLATLPASAEKTALTPVPVTLQNTADLEDRLKGALTVAVETLAAGGGGGGPFLPKAGGTLTGPVAFDATQPTATTAAPAIVQLTDSVSSSSTTTAATPASVRSAYSLATSAASTATAAQVTASAALPAISGTLGGTVRFNKLSGANGPVNLINGGPWVDGAAPTQPVFVFQPTNPLIGVNVDLMPTMTSSATMPSIIDLCNSDLRFLGSTAGQTWFHIKIGDDSNYYLGGDGGAGSTIGSLILQETGHKVGIGNFGQKFSNRVVPYYFSIRPYTTTLNYGVEIDTEATGMQVHSINDAGTRIPLSTVASKQVFTNDLSAGQRTKFFTVRPATNLNLDVHSTVETGTATTAVELSALADDEATQKALVARALRFELVPGGSSGRLQLKSTLAGTNVVVFSDDGSGGNRPILFGNSTITPLVPFQFNTGTDRNVTIDSTTVRSIVYGRVASITDSGAATKLALQTSELLYTSDGTVPSLKLNVSALTRTTYGGSCEWYSRSAGGTAAAPTASTTSSMARFIGYFYDGVNATEAAVQQVETATAVGTVTGSGNATVIVTAAGMTGTPKTFNVPVVNGDTPSVWAPKVVAALAADSAVTALYTVGGTGATITLTRITAAANDASLNISLDNGTCTGITTAATSVNTTAGSVLDGSWNAASYWDFKPTSTHSVSNRGTLFEVATTVDGTTSAASVAFTVDGSQNVVANKGHLQTGTAGKGVGVKSGANCKANSFTATGTTTVVSNTSITANSMVFFTCTTPGGTIGIAPYVSARTPGTSFTVTVTATDTSTYDYFIVEKL